MMIRATATKHLIGQDKNTFKMYIMMHQIWAMYTSNLFLQKNDLLIRWRTWDVWCCKKMQSNHWIFFWLLIYWDSPPYFACHNHLARPKNSYSRDSLETIIYFVRLKATRIHPSTNTFANSPKKNWRKSKKIEFVFHLVLLGHWLTK